VKAAPFLVFGFCDLILAISLVVGYGIVGGTCAPRVECGLPGVVCTAVCTSPWSQAPFIMAFGFVLGLPAAAAFSLAVVQAQGRPPDMFSSARKRLVLVATVIAGILFAISALAFFPRYTEPERVVAILVLLSAAICLLLAGQLLHRAKRMTLAPT